jgi:hypothetical protein
MAAEKPVRWYAILMGDLVGSEAAPSVARVHRSFNSAVTWANARHGARILSPLTITLGDEFQGLVDGLEHALTAATDLRLKLMREGLACRFVIGVADIRTRVNPERAWNMMGPGLAAARDKLNDKASGNAYRFSFLEDPALELLTDAVGDSLTQIEAGWTDTQKDYFLRSRLLGQTPATIAKGAKVSLGAVYKVLRAAQSDYYDRQAAALHKALTIQDERYGFG